MMRKVIPLLLLVFLMLQVDGTSHSLPGKPTSIKCRSPEKETFTCWWEPGSDGGLPTTHALYYRKENSEAVHECPDYKTAGKNSCFFNKNNTSIWINYNITVVATNALGSVFSDPVDIDVMYIVEPNPPENIVVDVVEYKPWPFLRLSWEPPQKADTQSGWITLMYEVRVKLEEDDEWETHFAGQQKVFNLFSLRSGGTYNVQVRCKPDHGFWSNWSSTSTVKVPHYFQRDKSVWILISVFAALIFLIFTWLIHMNSHNLKRCILPPVPGPKIKGFDKQLLKNGKSEDIINSLLVSDFPPTTTSNYEDLLVEFLDVYVPEEQELLLEENKVSHNNCLKCENTTSDSDSGRGSCDSHTLLMDKCEETKEEGWQMDQPGSQLEDNAKGRDEVHPYAHENAISPDMSDGKVKTWPSVFSPLPQYTSKPPDQMSSLEMAKQRCLSGSLFPPYHLSCQPQPGHIPRPGIGSNHKEFSFSSKQLNLHPKVRQQLHARSDINISTIGSKARSADLHQHSLPSSEYVEVQRVNEQDMVLLHPVSSDNEKPSAELRLAEDYSKVKRVDNDNVLLLLQKDGLDKEVVRCSNENLQTITATPQKSTACVLSALPLLDERPVTGYVDTSAMFNLPTY